MQATNFREQFTDVADACALAQSIVDTVREPILVLDKGLRVIAASSSFYSSFKVRPEDTQGRLLYTLGDGQWDIPKLRVLLEQIIPEHGVMDGYEVEHEFPDRWTAHDDLECPPGGLQGGAEDTILLGIEDVTERRILEREKDELLRQKDVMLEELQHRVANSLQIIAGIILMKAARVESEETRAHLHDAHKRVMSIAAVQAQLHASGIVGPIDVVPYLSKLCGTLATSMISDNRPITIKVVGEGGIANPREAESIGLIATELVMNAIKHAFPTDQSDGRIVIAYDVDGTNWKLSVADNGCGRPDGTFAQTKTGLGTGIVKALAQQLGAEVETLRGPGGHDSLDHPRHVPKQKKSRRVGKSEAFARQPPFGHSRNSPARAGAADAPVRGALPTKAFRAFGTAVAPTTYPRALPGGSMAVILIVEDEAPLLVLAESVLEHAGHDTLSAGSLAQAQAVIHLDADFDLVFTDIGLADQREGGLQVGQSTREARQGTPILYTSGMIITDGMRSLFVTPSEFLPKPYREHELLDAVSRLLAERPQ